LKPHQADALADGLPRLALTVPEPPASPLDLRQMIPGLHRAWLEIGFGAGEHLAWQAAGNPDVAFIGVEPYRAGLARLLVRAAADGLNNIRLYSDDAALLLVALAPSCLDRIFILFPDPWPKRRHHKRRVVQPETVALLVRALADGGELRMATDDRAYGEWCLALLTACADLQWLARRPADWQSWPDETPPTRYEEKARQAGRPVLYLTFRRRPRRAGPDSA